VKRLVAAVCAAAAAVMGAACGQKGPPLPPIVRTPVAPVITADRRGSIIELSLAVPSANVDGSRPANLTRIDIYAVNGATPAMTDLEMMKRGTKVASVRVKSPRNPDDAVEQGEPAEDAEPTVGEGLEQGSSSAIAETITASMLAPPAPARKRRETVSEPAGPLLGPAAMSQLRTYVGVGLDAHGRPGQFSRRVAVPLELSPLPPPPIAINYEERKIVITWKPLMTEADTVNVLPSRSLGPLQPEVAYNLYDATTGQLLNPRPVREFGYEDTRMDWGTKRCYIVRAVTVVARRAVESEPTEPHCETLVDSFPPAAPKGLNAVATDGAINLIWEANAEPDLAGYFVLRATGSGELIRITLEPVTDASFFDSVQRGVRFTYAVQAVDKAGNVSKASERVEETAH
jgi:hypothetical protein